MAEIDHELAFLLSLDGAEFRLLSAYVVKIEARSVAATRHRPGGIKYSLTLHDPTGNRIYGMDNAHGFAAGRNTTIGTFTDAVRSLVTDTAGWPNCWWISTAKWSGYFQNEACDDHQD